MLQKMQLARSVGISAALALTVVASGCGGNNSNNNQAVIAAFQLGQSSFNNITANRGNAPTAVSLSGATSIAANPNATATGARFFIADTGNNRILGYKTIPTTGSAVPDFVYGQDNMTSRIRSDLLNKPTSIKFSSDGTQLVVADSGNNRVLVWNSSLPSLTGTGQVAVSTAPDAIIGDTTSAHAAGTSATLLNNPLGASFAGTKLVVADTNNSRVLIFNTISNGASASVLLGQRTFNDNYVNCPKITTSNIDCSTGAAAVTADSLNTPADVWSDGNSMLVSDTGNNRVLYFPSVPTTLEAPATRVIGQTTMKVNSGPGTTQTTLNQPRGVWTDPNTNIIYIADSANNRVLAFNLPQFDGSPAVAVFGQGDYTHVTANDDDQNNVTDKDPNNQSRGIASDRTLSAPSGVGTFGSSTIPNKLFVADTNNSRLMVYDVGN